MAELNLIPNPTVLVVQAGVFLANMVIIKKLMIDPYMQVRDRREKLTVGSKDDASRMLAQCEAVQKTIESKLRSANAEARTAREAMREAAVAKRGQLLAVAEAEAKSHVTAIEGQIKQELAAERAKIPAILGALSQEVYELAVN